jgi:type I restriction enzyme M protein
MQLLTDFKETEQSKIFANEEFGYYEITVERPLRLRVIPDADITNIGLKAADLAKCQKALENVPSDTPLDDWNKYAAALGLTKTLLYKIRPFITVRDENAVPIEGEADKTLTDTEQVPLLYEGGIESFMQNEVLPYTPDAYVNEEKTVVGYELSFTKYFYKPVQLRPLHVIAKEIRDFDKETDGLLNEILAF